MPMADPHGSPDVSPPRYSGVRTFARLPQADTGAGADVAVIGAPFDLGTSFRPGARFGPEAIRSASALLRPYDPVAEVDVLGTLRVTDCGDVTAMPGDAERGIAQLAEGLAEKAADALPLVLGGDHLVALAELRALAARHGPLGLVLLDSHPDTWDSYNGQRYFHGTPFRRAVEEGLLDPSRSLLAGMRGSLYGPSDWGDARELGFELIPWQELRRLDPGDYGERARTRAGSGPALLSFDVDFVRALAGVDFRGFDVVEVSPPYDGPGQVTALLAANVAYAMLSLAARSRS